MRCPFCGYEESKVIDSARLMKKRANQKKKRMSQML